MKINFFVIFIFSVFLGTIFKIDLSFGVPKRASIKRNPNLLFIFTDDQIYRSINALNNNEIKTPHLNQLAKSSKVFTHVFNQGSYTTAVCVASRAMINTGKTIWNARQEIKNHNAKLWGETFKNFGYQTFVTGKWHNKEATLNRSFNWIGTINGTVLLNDPKNTSIIKRKYFKLRGMLGSKNNNDYRKGWKPDDVKLGGHWIKDNENKHSSEIITDSAIDFINKKSKRKPFFMYVAYFAPHDPRQSPSNYLNEYTEENIKMPKNFLNEHPFDIGARNIRAEKLLNYPRTTNAIKKHRRDYYAIMTHLDYQIGRLIDALKKRKEYKNTYIIFTSDHGLSMGEHGLMAKQSLYDHAQRVPFFISGPGLINNRQDHTLLNLHQLFSTTAELCNVPIPKTIPNTSFAHLIIKKNQENQYQNEILYGAYSTTKTNYSRMAMDHNYKLIVYPKAKTIQLFNRKNDPWEINNTAYQPQNKLIIQNLYIKLQNLSKKLNDPFLFPSFDEIYQWNKPLFNN